MCPKQTPKICEIQDLGSQAHPYKTRILRHILVKSRVFLFLEIYLLVWTDQVDFNLIMNIVAISNHLSYIFMNLNVWISVLPGTFWIKIGDSRHRINLWRPAQRLFWVLYHFWVINWNRDIYIGSLKNQIWYSFQW